MLSRQTTSPLPILYSFIGLLLVQVMKLGIILSQPNSEAFKYWFYTCFQYPPYSFQCHTIHGDVFPMAYSLLWYAVYVPLTAGGYWLFNGVMLTVDCIIGFLVAWKWSQIYLALWAQGSTYFLIVSPQDFLIWNMIMLGRTRYGPVFLVLAILTKFPLLPPILDPNLWSYIFNNPYSVHDPLNWARYSLLGFYWLFHLGLWLNKRGLLHVPVNRPIINPLSWIRHENPRGTVDRSHRPIPRRHSRNFHQLSFYCTRSLLRSPISGHHRATDLRSYHPLRSLPTHREWTQGKPGCGPTDPKFRPKALNPLRTLRRSAVLSGLFLLLLALAVTSPVYAASQYVGYPTTALGGSTCGVNCFNSDGLHGIGEVVQAPFAGRLVSVSVYTGSVLPNQVVILTANSITITSYNCGSTGTCGQTTAGQSMTVQDVEALSGLGALAFNTIVLASPVTVTNGQFVAIVFMLTSGSANGYVMFAGANGQSSVGDVEFNFGTSSPSGSYSTANGTASIIGGTFDTVGTPSQNLVQCYGNCGTPPVTLANTNSTHSTNFNSSITLFYQWQSNLNGFVSNVTAKVAKNYANGVSVQLSLYRTDPSCTASANPFTASCPGFISAVSPFFQNPQKGTVSFSTKTPAVNGEWFAVGVTATFSGVDLNDTNANVVLSQASGQSPGIITAFSSLGNSKLGLYAYLTGNAVITGPPSIPGGCNTASCGLVAFWNALGGDVVAGVIAFLVLFVFLLAVTFYFTRGHGSVFPILGPLSVIYAIVVLIMLSAAGVLPVYIPVLIIAVVAWLFTTNVLWRRHSGGGGDVTA